MRSIVVLEMMLFVLASAGCALPRATGSVVDSDLLWAGTIRGTSVSPLHRQIFGSALLDGRDYVRFFRERVDHITGEGILFAGCRGALACHGGARTVRVSSDYAELPIPRVIRLSYLLHEARHTEGWPHEKCEGPGRTRYQGLALDGLDACESSALGAYGIQIVMLRNVARSCESCDARTRHEAADYADDLLKRINSREARDLLENDSTAAGGAKVTPN